MAGEKSTRKSRRRKKRGRSSSSTSPSSDDISNQPVEGRGHGGLVAFPSEAPASGLPDYEWGWHKALFAGTNNNVDIMASVRDQLLCTCFICAILYAAEQDIVRWLAIEEPDRHPQIYFDFDTYVEQYETEVQNLLGEDVRFFYRTWDFRPRNALNVFLRDGVLAYSKSKEWPGGKIIKISGFQFHKDMVFADFENIISSGGSVIGGFPVGPEFKKLGHRIYEFSPVGVVRKPAGAHMVQFIGTGIDAGREFLVFLNSKKRFGKDGIGKVYFDQVYKGVYTLVCRAPPPPPPSVDPGLIVAGPDDNDDTLGSSGSAPDGNNKSNFSGAPDDNKAPSSTAPSKSLSQVGKSNRYDGDPIPSSCTVKLDGWIPSAPALLFEDTQTRTIAPIVRIFKQFKANLPPPEFIFCVTTEKKNCDIHGSWKKKSLDEMGTITRCFVPGTKMNNLHFTIVVLNINDKLGGLNSKPPLEHRQMIQIVNEITTLILVRDLSHGSSCLSDIPSSAGVSKNQPGRKHKQPISSSGPANSSATMNTTGPFPSLASSTPSTITISMPLMHHNASISSSLVACGADATWTTESPTDQIVDMYRFLEEDWLGHKVGSFFPRDGSAGLRDARSLCMACTKGFTFRDIYSAGASAKKVACFHFSSNGNLLATGVHHMKLGRLPLEPTAVRDCNEEVGMLFHSTSSIPNVPNWSTEGVISHAKIEDIKAMEKQRPESRESLLKSHAHMAFKQKKHKMASQIYGLYVTKRVRHLYANRSLCKLLMGDGEDALPDALRCSMLRPACAKACYREASVLMLLKEYKQAHDGLLDAQNLDSGDADIESELRKARELMKNPPVEGA